MRVLIFGAGAVGSVLGGFLARQNHEVAFLGRPANMDAIRQNGLKVSGIWGEHIIRAIRTAGSIEVLGCEWDWIFVCVKSYQTKQAAAELSALLGPKTLVCAFQNGLGNYETLCASVPVQRLALGRVIFGVEQSPGSVRVTVCADDVLVGSPSAAFPEKELAVLAEALRQSGIPARAEKAITTALWGKVLYNCALNPLSMLLEVPYGGLLEKENTRQIMRRVIEEAYAAAGLHGVRLVPDSAQAYCRLLFERLIPDTAAHHSSMLQDIQRSRRTEIDALNGAIVKLAEEKNRSAPMNALLTRLVYARERMVGAR